MFRFYACTGFALVAAALLLAVPNARAADQRGGYAVRGAGLMSCAVFNQARKDKGDAYLVVAAWIDGYITGVNQYAAKTYDVAPFESTELFMNVVGQYCGGHPQARVFGVLLDLFKQLWPDRLADKSDKVPVAGSGHATRLYVEVVERMQRKLKASGDYSGSIDGKLSAETVEALKKYQRAIGFKPTGFPDQATLWRLLRSDKHPVGRATN